MPVIQLYPKEVVLTDFELEHSDDYVLVVACTDEQLREFSNVKWIHCVEITNMDSKDVDEDITDHPCGLLDSLLRMLNKLESAQEDMQLARINELLDKLFGKTS